MTGFYLLDHPPRTAQYRDPRRGRVEHIMLHVTTQPFDLIGEDTHAEELAAYTTRRTTPGSYHSVSDRDSTVPMVPDHMEAFGSRHGWNETTWHHAIAGSTDWDSLSDEHRAAYGIRAAEACARASRAHDVPAVRANPATRSRGFLGHADADPDRRTDPGWNDTEWNEFLRVVAGLVSAPIVWKEPAPGRFWGTGRWPKWHVAADGAVTSVNGAPEIKQLTEFGIAHPDEPITRAWWDEDLDRLILESEADGGTFALPTR